MVCVFTWHQPDTFENGCWMQQLIVLSCIAWRTTDAKLGCLTISQNVRISFTCWTTLTNVKRKRDVSLITRWNCETQLCLWSRFLLCPPARQCYISTRLQITLYNLLSTMEQACVDKQSHTVVWGRSLELTQSSDWSGISMQWQKYCLFWTQHYSLRLSKPAQNRFSDLDTVQSIRFL